MSSWFSFPHSDPSEVGDHVGSSVLSKEQWLAGNHPSQRRTYTLPTYQRQPPNTQQLHSIGFDARVRLKMLIPTIAVYCALVMVVPARAKAPLPGT
ncbi:uncharacterized protein QC764_0102420 [Podospora pseudoanserina]|uniref:Uncharacterized protein n=1 Tax=Podospora pseudoanserina TaxID=2609844 RepID=A0ABR0HK52_9PEZI|nr:hypothetical protein QC764_0102420 [Podospora pseudoanserina]